MHFFFFYEKCVAVKSFRMSLVKPSFHFLLPIYKKYKKKKKKKKTIRHVCTRITSSFSAIQFVLSLNDP